MSRLATLMLAVGLGACELPELFGEPVECERNSDCDDDEDCDDGECVEEDDDDGEGEGPGEGEGEGEVVDPPPDPEGPRFLQLSTNVTTLFETDLLIVTAVLTDDDGVDDIIGGSLVDPATGATYGAFQTSAAEGSYSLSLDWNSIDTVSAIDFATTGNRNLQARFFDVAGHEAARTVQVSLACSGGGPACDGICNRARCSGGSCTTSFDAPDFEGNGICNNVCEDLTTASDCGACGNSCGGNSCGDFGDFFACTCDSGSDCSSGTTCHDAQCSALELVFDTAFPINQFPGVELGFSSFTLCTMSQSETELFCNAAGFENGTPRSTGHFTGFGVDANCSAAATFEDCLFTTSDSCDIGPIDCFNGNPGQLAQFFGPQRNVPTASLTGWQLCHQDLYLDSGTLLSTILSNCPGDQLMLACRDVATPGTIRLLAHAPRADVTFESGSGNVTRNSNGSEWYFNGASSWGFAAGGDTVSRNSCDIADGNPPIDADRLCWHTSSNALDSGFRCGAGDLNGSSTVERLVFTSTGG